MKKILVVGLAVLLSAGVAFAKDPCSGYDCIGQGSLKTSAEAFGAQGDIDILKGCGALAIGANGGIGAAQAAGGGFVFNGAAGVEVTAVGGSLGNTKKIYSGEADYVRGTSSYNEAVTAGSVKVFADGGKYIAFTGAAGEFAGFAAQGTLNASVMTDGYRWNSEGITGGVAGQGSAGYIVGGAYAISGPDYTTIEKVWNPCKRRFEYKLVNVDSNAEAGAEAGISMNGGSFSVSYRDKSYHDGYRTETLGTNVGAFTNVESYGSAGSYDNGLATSGAYVGGGWVAAGGAASYTAQQNQGGGASASAIGTYSGSGALGCDYTGSAIGGTQTFSTTKNGLNGSINGASSSMSVTSQVGHSQNIQSAK